MIKKKLVFIEKLHPSFTFIEDRHREAALLSNLADFFYQAGDADTAMTHIKKSVAILSEIGAAAGDIQLEIWKLTEW